jgi:hypothetical protein
MLKSIVQAAFDSLIVRVVHPVPAPSHNSGWDQRFPLIFALGPTARCRGLDCPFRVSVAKTENSKRP